MNCNFVRNTVKKYLAPAAHYGAVLLVRYGKIEAFRYGFEDQYRQFHTGMGSIDDFEYYHHFDNSDISVSI